MLILAKGFVGLYTSWNMKDKKHQNIKIEKLPASKVKIIGEVTTEAFEKARKTALEHITIATEIPGFRAGKAPEAMVVKHVGEIRILERAAESAINDIYGDILEEHDIRAIGAPAIAITKIAAGNPLGFTIETSVMPEIVVGDYKKTAKTAVAQVADPKTTVEEKEIDAVIEDIRKHVGSMMVDEPGSEGTDTEDAKTPTDDAEKPKKEKELPVFDDEFVKKIGNYENVAAFRKSTQENIIEHKKREVREKRRALIAEQLIADAKFEVPELIITSELDTMIGQFKADIQRNGFTFEGYLEQIKKTEDEIRKEWRESAEKRARLELILKKIAREEKIAPTEEEVKKEVDHILSHHKDAERFRVRMYVENLMTNQKVFDFLEGQK